MNFDRRKFGSAADYIKQYERRVRERLLRTEHQHELVVQ